MSGTVLGIPGVPDKQISVLVLVYFVTSERLSVAEPLCHRAVQGSVQSGGNSTDEVAKRI